MSIDHIPPDKLRQLPVIRKVPLRKGQSDALLRIDGRSLREEFHGVLGIYHWNGDLQRGWTIYVPGWSHYGLQF